MKKLLLSLFFMLLFIPVIKAQEYILVPDTVGGNYNHYKIVGFKQDTQHTYLPVIIASIKSGVSMSDSSNAWIQKQIAANTGSTSLLWATANSRTTGTAADSVSFTGTSSEVIVNMLGNPSTDTLYVSNSTAFTAGLTIGIPGGTSFDSKLLYTNKIYFKGVRSSMPIEILVR